MATKFRNPFVDFAPVIRAPTPLRRAITSAYRRCERTCVLQLLDDATLPADIAAATKQMARDLITALRAKGKGSGIGALVQEYSLSSEEGVALMCLAEALLRIPDSETRDALIRDKIAKGDWHSHLGEGRSLFVNAATWGLVVTGKLLGSVDNEGLSATLTNLVMRIGEPVIRHSVDLVMEMMGEQFVTGQTIEAALQRASKIEPKGYSYSYDMLGEAAVTASDAARYYSDYERAVHAIGTASAGRGVYAGPGISIKLSALHPRYSRSQAARVMSELLPRIKTLARLAKDYDIGFNIDAEEADRLELSLDLLEELALDPELSAWEGLGFVVQAYGKRCPFVIDWLIDLAERSKRRIMVRLVKGAYWDSEIKRAQVEGLKDFPVYTRKAHSDIAYMACAKKLLAAKQALFPQFATHNAQTLAAIYQLAGPEFTFGDYEFQCLHGMGEPLYNEIVGADRAGQSSQPNRPSDSRPCRIYAPVGTHETLLAYLVRRLLENGANTSFVNRIADPTVSVEDLIADPAATVRAMDTVGAPHPKIRLPANIYDERSNSSGIDLSDEEALAELGASLLQSTSNDWCATPTGGGVATASSMRTLCNPADSRDVVGQVQEASSEIAGRAVSLAAEAFSAWSQLECNKRAAMLEKAADALQAEMPMLIGLLVREAGKTAANAIGEVREAIDFLRYYAKEGRATLQPCASPVLTNRAPENRALGPVVCISPWNFPLAIFIGQIAAALVTGNTVLAKPAEETPLIAAQAIRILHDAGIPENVVQFLPGDGVLGAALVADEKTVGVIFTGSTEVARLIQQQLASRVSATGAPIPLIAETGGQNVMIVDSSALAEQVVADVLASAFDSAGQRCSALRVLCLQQDCAGPILAMLKNALAELTVGCPDQLKTDIGPVITAEAQERILAHIAAMRAAGCAVEQILLGEATAQGIFVAPTIIEIESIDQLDQEVFGPVLHVLSYRRDELDALVEAINATGYGLTFGVHTRLNSTIDKLVSRISAGNIYVNRNIIGAVVGSQPFGGNGLSGTGPKAGGPLYLGRLLASPPQCRIKWPALSDPALQNFTDWLTKSPDFDFDVDTQAVAAASGLGYRAELPGPVGESNRYELHGRGTILLLPDSKEALVRQLLAVFATGNDALVGSDAGIGDQALRSAFARLPSAVSGAVPSAVPETLAKRVTWAKDWQNRGPFAGVLIEDDKNTLQAKLAEIAALKGQIPIVQIAQNAGAAVSRASLLAGSSYRLDWLLKEVSISTDMTAVGGNASLMTLA